MLDFPCADRSFLFCVPSIHLAFVFFLVKFISAKKGTANSQEDHNLHMAQMSAVITTTKRDPNGVKGNQARTNKFFFFFRFWFQMLRANRLNMLCT